jgi:hypothetical protein
MDSERPRPDSHGAPVSEPPADRAPSAGAELPPGWRWARQPNHDDIDATFRNAGRLFLRALGCRLLGHDWMVSDPHDDLALDWRLCERCGRTERPVFSAAADGGREGDE